MEFYRLTLGILGVWRITHLLQAEDGPWDVIVHLRGVAGDGIWGSLLDCFYCISLWIAAPFAIWLGDSTAEKLLLWPALSGAAILLERITARAPLQAAPDWKPYWQEEKSDVLLREEENQH